MATATAPELVSVNPATLERVGSVPRTEPREVPAIVAAARSAQSGWAAVSSRGRADVLRATARLVREHADEIADSIVAETAKPRTEAIANELYTAVDRARWLAANAPGLLADERVRFSQLHLKTKKAWLVHEPLGVVAAISPWNIPFAIPFVQVAAAVAAGNGVVLKPSELTPLTAEWVPRLLEEAGAPPGLVQVVQGEGDAGEAVVADDGIAKVFFTGSVTTGRRVAAAAGARGCPVVLELGGKDPMIVFADADLDRAVDGAVFASFLNAGQACVSAERIYVERAVHDEFMRRLSERAGRLELGREVGPLISRSSATQSSAWRLPPVRSATAGSSSRRWCAARSPTRRSSGPSSRSSRSTARTTLCAARTTASSASRPACGRATERRPTVSRAASRRAWCGSTTSATRSPWGRRRGAESRARDSVARARSTASTSVCG
jgi:acyl-CoA reductase-like NAD-dependent aldehyde dehydrogenase